jgi:hypothetical protein
MKQRKRITPRTSVNDNAPPAVAAKDIGHGQDVSHLYVQKPEKHGAEMPRRAAAGTWKPTQIYTDLPANLPIMPEEIALLRGFMGDLVSRIIANDNDPL